MSRLDQKRERKLQPERIKYAILEINNLGFDILFHNDTEVQFLYKNERVNFFAYSGWHTGKSIKDGRGIQKLLNQIKPECKRCNDEMRIKDYENGDLHSEDGKMPCMDCQQ